MLACRNGRRDSLTIRARAIDRATTRPWTVMEVCGGQTHGIVRYGIDELLPDRITLVREDWTAPASLPFGELTVIPLRAGEKLRWRLLEEHA